MTAREIHAEIKKAKALAKGNKQNPLEKLNARNVLAGRLLELFCEAEDEVRLKVAKILDRVSLTPEPTDLLTLEEAASVLCVSKRTVQRFVSRDVIKTTKDKSGIVGWSILEYVGLPSGREVLSTEEK